MGIEPRPRLLVTGVSGFLGSRVKALATDGAWDLAGTSRSGSGLRMDLLDRQSVRDVMTHARPAVVVHAAYAKDVPEMDAVIVAGSEAVAAECERVGARLIYVSTDAVFSGRAGRPYAEDDPVDPVTAYGWAKAGAEEVVRNRCADTVIVRTSLLIGPPAYPGHQVLRAQRPDPGYWADVVRCPLHVDDLALAILELARRPWRGVLHIGGPQPMSRQALFELVTGRPWPSDAPHEGPASDMRLDSSLAHSMLATPTRNVRATLAEHGSQRRAGGWTT